MATDLSTSALSQPIISTSKVVTTVFQRILQSVHDGDLLPGQRISDGQLAEYFGVSRTPVREALQRLREIGIVEASAGRFTRIADVTPVQTANAFIVWRALYGTLVEEVVPRTFPEIVEQLRNDHALYQIAVDDLDAHAIAKANFDFFSRLPTISQNVTLQRAIVSVVHIVRLGSLHLPHFIDVEALGRAQTLLIEAADAHAIAPARRAMNELGSIAVPVD